MTVPVPGPENDTVPSPCTRVCVIDPVSALCRGCLRTIDEITDWSGKSPAEKRAVLTALEKRREK
jgi:uncharacterized protein